MDALRQYLFIYVTVYTFVAELDAVTVSPTLCPPDKFLSPRRRHQASELNRPRSLGLIYDLLGSSRPLGSKLVNDLKEQPQDDQNDCDEVRDYDEELTSGRIRPIKEDILDWPQAPYRPGLIGGLLGHIVGFPSVRPPTEDEPQKTKEREKTPLREPGSPIPFPSNDSNDIKRQKNFQETNKPGIIGSFVDFLFKKL